MAAIDFSMIDTPTPMPTLDGAVLSDPEIVHGEPAFIGTRVFVASLFEWLADGSTLDDYLENFPRVTRERAIQVLEYAKAFTVANAPTAR